MIKNQSKKSLSNNQEVFFIFFKQIYGVGYDNTGQVGFGERMTYANPIHIQLPGRIKIV